MTFLEFEIVKVFDIYDGISFSLLWGMDVAARKAEEYHAAYMKASGSLPGKIWEAPGDPWKSLIPGLDWQVIQKRQAFGALKQNYVNSIYVIFL